MQLKRLIPALVMGTIPAVAQLPPPADHEIDFAEEIAPILNARCVKCHGKGKTKGGFNFDTRESMMREADSGVPVVPGDSGRSYLIELVAGIDPDNVMPKKGSRLTGEEVGLFRAWIDQGLVWPDRISFAKQPVLNLEPRRPEIPADRYGLATANPIDAFLATYFRRIDHEPAPPIDDRLFIRRAYLDLLGLLPTPEEVSEFSADHRYDKRTRLVDRLIADNTNYAQHWLTFWNDVLRNDYRGTGYIDGGREQITSWLYSSLASNKPYDRFVGELIDPAPGAEGFIKGIVWRGVVNASQRPEMQAAQNISQVFMGVNLKCASCHDSFINDWSLADAYGLAGVFADERMEMFECDRPTGEYAPVKFIHPELGSIDGAADREQRLEQLAALMTRPSNGRFSRTIVNRLWARFFGRGLVTTLDDMEQPAWYPDLLDWMAADLVAHDFDLKHLIRVISTSQAYQLPAVAGGERVESEFVFHGPLVKRMSAEQFLDAVSTVTGHWPTEGAAAIDWFAGLPQDRRMEYLADAVNARWVWTQASAAESAPPQTTYFRKRFRLSGVPDRAVAISAADNEFELFVNGREAGGSKNWERPQEIDLKPYLVEGANLLAVQAKNGGDGPNPAGFVLYARFDESSDGERPILELITDQTWIASNELVGDWRSTDFAASGWRPVEILGDLAASPWNLRQEMLSAVSRLRRPSQVRASLLNADPLSTALGRPNREQVITTRASVATTLQALELTNGEVFARKLKSGAAALAASYSEDDLIQVVFKRGLSRSPSERELEMARAMIGGSETHAGVEDLLWSVSMLPEFQLIY